METLEFNYSGGQAIAPRSKPVLAGVLGSGNLEVLVEPDVVGSGFNVAVKTAAVGFEAIWQAVLNDVFDRWRLAGVRISINDAGATPAVVSLRLDQALSMFSGTAV